jgi:hypothetical protein
MVLEAVCVTRGGVDIGYVYSLSSSRNTSSGAIESLGSLVGGMFFLE